MPGCLIFRAKELFIWGPHKLEAESSEMRKEAVMIPGAEHSSAAGMEKLQANIQCLHALQSCSCILLQPEATYTALVPTGSIQVATRTHCFKIRTATWNFSQGVATHCEKTADVCCRGSYFPMMSKMISRDLNKSNSMHSLVSLQVG